jgi:NADH-quinone oxidoreductase subunit L
VSQGGYVLLFLGSGGYAAGILHLFTHGFVKTALFLAAGSIVQGLGTADIRQMGGLWKRFPITALGSLLAILALGGAPWLSVSYSTNLGLACVYDYAHALQATNGRLIAILLFHLPAVCTYITALGIGRWWWLTFAGTNRNAKLLDAAHESAFLTLPIILLAAFLAGGLYQFAGILPLIGKSVPTILTVRGPGTHSLVLEGSPQAYLLAVRETGWAFLGLGAAVFIHLNGLALANRLRRLPGINVLDYWLRERMFFDEVFEGLLVPALLLLARITGVVEWLGRIFVKIISVLVGVMVGLVAWIERSTELQTAPVAGDAPPASPDTEGASGESLSP